MSDNFESACKSVVASLGYSILKNEQYAVIKSFVLGSDVFGVLPTGYGKTLCYACLPAGIFDELSGSQSYSGSDKSIQTFCRRLGLRTSSINFLLNQSFPHRYNMLR